MDLALQSVQGLIIATHIGEVEVEMWKDRYMKALTCKTDEEKEIPNLLGFNLTYLLRLGHVAPHKDLPPMGK